MSSTRGVYEFMIFIGIDPGATGAIATIKKFVQDKPIIYYNVYDCPELMIERVNLIRKIIDTSEKISCMIEKVHAFHKSAAKSAFEFGGNFYAWQAILSSFKVPYEFVTPQKWQKEMHDSAKKLGNIKAQSVELASRLYPNVEFKTRRGRILDGRSDALLIATYLQRKYNGVY